MLTDEQEHIINLRVTSYTQLVIKKAGTCIHIRNQTPKTNDGEKVFKRVSNILNMMGIEHHQRKLNHDNQISH